MTKTIHQQQEDTDQVIKLIKDGNALANKLAGELRNCRIRLELLRAFQPDDQFKVDLPYSLREKPSEQASMRQIIDKQIAQINAILGDRA